MQLCHRDGKWLGNKWVKLVRGYCFEYWVEWKTGLTMMDVDEQVKELFPVIQEGGIFSDDGKEMRIRAPWIQKDE